MKFSRRALLSSLPATLLPGALVPGAMLGARPARAETDEKRLLMIFIDGGWDPTYVFAPMFGYSSIDMDSTAQLSHIGGLDFTDSPQRPFVRQFFEKNASRTCIMNGMEIPSVTHPRCQRLLFTGKTADGVDDWPTLIANHTNAPLPYLVVSGPSFSGASPLTAVRMGENGQLADLLTGNALTSYNDSPVTVLPDTAELRIRELMNSRAEEFKVGKQGFARYFADSWMSLLNRVESLDELQSKVDLGGSRLLAMARVTDRLAPAIEAMAAGYSRCTLIRHGGQYDRSWDTHHNNTDQSSHFETLFEDLGVLMDMLDSRTGVSGKPLSEETVVVVVSEMGRTPKLNVNFGKDHWTFSSAMFIGGNTVGGRMVGGFDSELMGQSVDPRSGQVGGDEPLTVESLGATLLAMMDVDPGITTDAAPIEAVFTA